MSLRANTSRERAPDAGLRDATQHLVIPEAAARGCPESILTTVVMDSGFDASHRPGMTAWKGPGLLRACAPLNGAINPRPPAGIFRLQAANPAILPSSDPVKES